MADSRTIIVSNRLPVATAQVDGRTVLQPSTGGLVSGLEGVHGTDGSSLWVGCLGVSAEQRESLSAEDTRVLTENSLSAVDVPEDLYDAYYEGFSNSAIWPLFHYLPERCSFAGEEYEAYRRVNELFADAIESAWRDGDRIWIQDYQLMLLPRLLRERKRNASIGFFLHIPFPSTEIFRILPWRDEILDGLLGADLVGFHTLEYARHFSNAAHRIEGLESQVHNLKIGSRTVRIGAFPLGIDVEAMYARSRSTETDKRLTRLRASFANRSVLLGVDRLDYTKGVPDRLKAFEAMLTANPDRVGQVSLVQVSVPSRVKVDEYRDIKAEVDELVGRINGRFGAAGYTPIHYIFRNLGKEDLFALYRLADVALVTPIRDGLNLVCKEYVACKGEEPGALVLSEFAGSAAEMGEAILVNPWNRKRFIEGIERALEMSTAAKERMMRSLWDRLAKNDNRAWSRGFLNALDDVHAENQTRGYLQIVEPDRAELFERARRANRVFLFLDYDGTLVPIVDTPELAVPNEEISALFDRMASEKKIVCCIVSGRDRDFLDEHVPPALTIAAEHGACIRRAHESECVHFVDRNAYLQFREEVIGVMHDYEKRIPGSTIEEKEFGLVWHYRMAAGLFAEQQALVLADTLGELLQRTNLGVSMAKKAVEVRHLGVNKGEAVRVLLKEEGFDREHDLLLTMGDDRTDQDMFRVNVDVNVSIGVSEVAMGSRYVMGRESAVELLTELVEQASD